MARPTRHDGRSRLCLDQRISLSVCFLLIDLFLGTASCVAAADEAKPMTDVLSAARITDIEIMLSFPFSCMELL